MKYWLFFNILIISFLLWNTWYMKCGFWVVISIYLVFMVQKTYKYINGKPIEVLKRFQVTSEWFSSISICFLSLNIFLLKKMSYDVDNFGVVAHGANFLFCKLWTCFVCDNCIINDKYMTLLVFSILQNFWKWRSRVCNFIIF